MTYAYLPYHEHSYVVLPTLGHGNTATGLYARFNEKLPPVLAVVLSRHCQHCRYKPGSLLVMRPYSCDTTLTVDGEVSILQEGKVMALIEGAVTGGDQ